MARSLHFKYALLILCLGAANLPAQEPEMKAPPVPEVAPPLPPDPDTLPPPPQLQFSSLPPRDPEEGSGGGTVVAIAGPQDEVPIAPPPQPVIEPLLPGTGDAAAMELAKPEVEIWREESELPQIPSRRYNQLAEAYIAGTDPVILRVQFDPQAAGKQLHLLPGRGITLQPPNAVLTISSSGECIVSARMPDSVARSHIIFYCEGIKTVLPIAQASLATVEAMEAESGGGH